MTVGRCGRGTTVTRVMLVDDQELVRSGLRRILRRRDGFEIVVECSDGEQVPDALAEHDVDVIVMDLRMKGVGGIEATRRVRDDAEAPPVLVLTTFDDDEMLSGALRAGAAGFILKDSSAEDLIRAVRTVADGASWLDPAVTARVLSRYREAPGAAPAGAAARRQPAAHDPRAGGAARHRLRAVEHRDRRRRCTSPSSPSRATSAGCS